MWVTKNKTDVYALGQHISMSVHKARRVIDQIRGRSYEETLMILELMPYRACYPIFKLVYSAAANATYLLDSKEANLVISKAEVNEGTNMKRIKLGARGRSHPIKRPTCHITIVMKDISIEEYDEDLFFAEDKCGKRKIREWVKIKKTKGKNKSQNKSKNKYPVSEYHNMYSNGGAWDKK